MALSVDWDDKIITVPRTDMLLVQTVPFEVRQLDIDAFRLELKSLESSNEGIPFLDTHSHNTTVTIGGVTLARVVEIINGYTVTFEDGQYAVDLVGANSNISDVANLNQVSIRASNSAGLTYSDAINKQSFLNGLIYINPVDGLNGTDFPRGTPSDPVDNYDDALTIIEANKLEGFKLEGVLSLSGTQNSQNYSWFGYGVQHSELRLNGSNVNQTSFEDLLLAGTGSGIISCKECLLNNFSNFRGSLKECSIRNTLSLDSGSNGVTSFNFCSSNQTGSAATIIDWNSSLSNGEFRYFAGSIDLRNFNQGGNLEIDIMAGHVILDSSCTSGTVLIRGNCKVTDNTTGAGITVNTDHIVNSQVESVKRDTALIPATL